jgi:hypothetical protein
MLEQFPYARVDMLAELGDRRSGGVCNTRGTTTPANLPGRVFVSGRTRLLSGKSSATSEPLADHARTNNVTAAVITEYRRMRRFLVNSLIWPTAAGSI